MNTYLYLPILMYSISIRINVISLKTDMSPIFIYLALFSTLFINASSCSAKNTMGYLLENLGNTAIWTPIFRSQRNHHFSRWTRHSRWPQEISWDYMSCHQLTFLSLFQDYFSYTGGLKLYFLSWHFCSQVFWWCSP